MEDDFMQARIFIITVVVIVAFPVRIIRDSSALVRHFKRAYRSIRSDSRDELKTRQDLAKLYVLRNAIEAAPVEDVEPVINEKFLKVPM